MAYQALVLSDGTHRFAQAEYVLRAMNADYEILEPHYGDVSFQPQLIFSIGSNHTNDVVSFIDKLPSKPVCVNMLDSRTYRDFFDLLVMPNYEPVTDQMNAIVTQGIVNKINAHALKAAESWIYPNPLVGVLLGGKHVYGSITLEKTSQFVEYLNREAGSVYVTTSPRTPDEIAACFSHLTVKHSIYNWKHDRHIANPYINILANADILIVSGDSVRMISEACSTGKPVYIWLPDGGVLSYARLYQQLLRSGHACVLELSKSLKNSFSQQVGVPLDEAKRVANAIVQILMQKSSKMP